MKAIYIRETKSVPYAHAIVRKYKLCESRTRNMLGRLVGERVAIIRTQSGKRPEIIGYATVTRSEWVNKEEFDKRFCEHLVPTGSKFDCHGEGKWLYYFEDAIECDPYPVPTTAVRHGRAWCEF